MWDPCRLSVGALLVSIMSQSACGTAQEARADERASSIRCEGYCEFNHRCVPGGISVAKCLPLCREEGRPIRAVIGYYENVRICLKHAPCDITGGDEWDVLDLCFHKVAEEFSHTDGLVEKCQARAQECEQLDPDAFHLPPYCTFTNVLKQRARDASEACLSQPCDALRACLWDEQDRNAFIADLPPDTEAVWWYSDGAAAEEDPGSPAISGGRP